VRFVAGALRAVDRPAVALLAVLLVALAAVDLLAAFLAGIALAFAFLAVAVVFAAVLFVPVLFVPAVFVATLAARVPVFLAADERVPVAFAVLLAAADRLVLLAAVVRLPAVERLVEALPALARVPVAFVPGLLADRELDAELGERVADARDEELLLLRADVLLLARDPPEAEPDAAALVAAAIFFVPAMMSLKPCPGRNAGTEVFLTFTASPVRGFRAVRALRILFSKTPKPVIATRSPFDTARWISSTTLSRAAVAVLRSPRRVISVSMSSALFTVPLPRVLGQIMAFGANVRPGNWM
jgi:hypothetical protein